jgi:soluble cytochrome b562
LVPKSKKQSRLFFSHSYKLVAQFRHASALSKKILTKAQLLEPAHKILRTALKLLLTTSALILVPRVIDLPVSLSTHLSLQSSPGGSSSAVPSFDAPKLLSRQVKSGTCHLQKKLLLALFSDLRKELLVEVRLSVALIVSFVLELMRKVARDFARYANQINQTVFVDEKDVNDYERSMENIVFDTLRASVYGSRGSVDGEMGELGDRLRNLSK